MVFDMTDNEQRKSLHAVKEWKDQLFRYSSKQDVPIILAGNKVYRFIILIHSSLLWFCLCITDTCINYFFNHGTWFLCSVKVQQLIEQLLDMQNTWLNDWAFTHSWKSLQRRTTKLRLCLKELLT